ncbi:MAG: hypothetical protein QM731_23105 [Chitinophagaceae bacterium]
MNRRALLAVNLSWLIVLLNAREEAPAHAGDPLPVLLLQMILKVIIAMLILAIRKIFAYAN